MQEHPDFLDGANPIYCFQKDKEMTKEEKEELKELKRCFRYLSKRYGWTFGFSTSVYHGYLQIPKVKLDPGVSDRRRKFAALKVNFGDAIERGGTEFRFGYEAYRKSHFPTLDSLFEEYRLDFNAETQSLLERLRIRWTGMNDTRAREQSEMNASIVLENPTKDNVVYSGLTCLYDMLTSGRFLLASRPMRIGDKGEFLVRYLPTDFPKFKTLEELVIKLDLMDFKPETYTFKIPQQ